MPGGTAILRLSEMNMKKTIIAIAALTILVGCGVNPQTATRALEAQGLTQVDIGGWSMFGCGQEDNFKSSFKAVGANGQKVTGTVCSGWFKGVTVRYD